MYLLSTSRTAPTCSVLVVVDDEQGVAEAMWGWDIHWAPYEDRFIMGRGGIVQAGVLRGALVALWSKHESQEIFITELANAGLVGTP
jgi:hypothetical protein